MSADEGIRSPRSDIDQSVRAVERHVRRLHRDDVRSAAVVLARAFVDEPSAVALLPDPEERRRFAVFKAEQVVRSVLPHATGFGATSGEQLAGVAVWHPPNVTPRSASATFGFLAGVAAFAPEFGRALGSAVGELWRDRQALLRFAKQRPRALREAAEEPSWYLAVLGTDPRFQGQGVGRRLLDHVLERCDEDQVGVWLETTDPANVPLYERFGFRTTAQLDGGTVVPDLWVMRREPQPLGLPRLTTD